MDIEEVAEGVARHVDGGGAPVDFPVDTAPEIR